MISKLQLYDIASDMVEQMGPVAFLDELFQSMSSDELFENLKHIDRHCFENHYSEHFELRKF